MFYVLSNLLLKTSPKRKKEREEKENPLKGVKEREEKKEREKGFIHETESQIGSAN